MQVPIAEGLIAMPLSPAEEPRLIGSKCRSCGEVSFPSRLRCRRCSGSDLEKVGLSRKGRLHSFTTVLVKLPGARVDPPYLVGVVELPEGERIRTLLAGADQESLRIGQEMELAVCVVYKDESEKEVLGWKFRPADDGDPA